VTIRPTAGLGRVLQILMLAAAVLALLVYAWLYARLRNGTFVLHVPDANGPPDTAYWTGTSLSSATVGLLYVPGAVMLAAEILWLFWQHRATENLWARGYQGLRVRPGWAVGWWFVPIANLFMPCVAMLELDRRSTPDGMPRRASPLVGVWWGSWIVYSFLPTVGLFIAAYRPFVDLFRGVDERTTSFDFSPVAHAAAPWLLVTALWLLVTAVAAVGVVRRIDTAQDAMLGSPSGWLVPVPARPDAIS
jgi:hypothetical protein